MLRRGPGQVSGHVRERAAAEENKEVRELLREMARAEVEEGVERKDDEDDEDDDDDIAAKVGAHTWVRPSKWVEKRSEKRRGEGEEGGSRTSAKIVDHFVLV